MKLKPAKANAKLRKLYDVPRLKRWLKNNRKVYSFDLLSGHSCPFAKDCLAKVVVQPDGKKKLVDGPDTEFRCFSASQEVIFPGVYDHRNGHFEALRGKSLGEMAQILTDMLPKDAGIVRIHVAGDFFNQAYFDAWTFVAFSNPKILFYAYTKSLPYWVNRIAGIPDNFVLTASRGGRMDHMIEQYELRSVKVVFSEAEAKQLGLQIDHDDSHAAIPRLRDKDFALLIHGVNPAGSKASKAVNRLKKSGAQYSYGRK